MKASGFNPRALTINTLQAVRDVTVLDIISAKALGGAHCKRDLELDLLIQSKNGTRQRVKQGMSQKRSSKGAGGSNQTVRGWIDHTCLASEKAVKAFSNNGCDPMECCSNLSRQLGLGISARRVKTGQELPAIPDEADSKQAMIDFNSSPSMRNSAVDMALSTLDCDLSQSAQKPGPKRHAGLLMLQFGVGATNNMRGTHKMAVPSEIRKIWERSKSKTPLFDASAICNGKGRAVHIFFKDSVGKSITVMSIKRKGSSKDPYCDHAQIQLNMRGASKLLAHLASLGHCVHTEQKVS